MVSVSHDFVIKGKGIKVVNIPAEQCSGGGRVEVSEVQLRNPPYSGYFLMFCGSQSHAFSCKHETHDLLTLVS